MEGFKRQAVLLALLDAMKEYESWCGETHVQKCAYFLEEGLDVPLELGFILYKHGPFSFELREVLGEMRGNLLIDVESRSPYGASLIVSESGRALKERFPKTIAQHAPPIRFVAERLSQRPVAELERLGTALYVVRECPDASNGARAQRVVEIKPHIQLTQAQAAVQEVDQLLAQASTLS
jgi:hypothetical protein